MPSSKTTITKSEYHSLLGLMLLAKRHNDAQLEIISAVTEIVGEIEQDGKPKGPKDGGFAADEVYSTYEPCADDLLKSLHLTVAD